MPAAQYNRTNILQVEKGIRRNAGRSGKEAKRDRAENSRLKKLVADLSLDNAILKETVRGNY
jgi:hypothetical protein